MASREIPKVPTWGRITIYPNVVKQLKSLLGLSLVSLILIISITKTTSIGGSIALALERPANPAIDTTSARLIQNPVEFVSQSRGFAWYHAGIDLAAKTGTPVKPIMAGIVQKTAYHNLYGNYVVIAHNQNLESLYAHLSKIYVKENQEVSLEAVIGEIGSTGFSTGPHLHLEIRQNGKFLNPAEIVPRLN